MGGVKNVSTLDVYGLFSRRKSVFEIGCQWWRRLSRGFIWAFISGEFVKESRKNGIFLKIAVVEEFVRKGLLCVLQWWSRSRKVEKMTFF